MTMRPTMVSIMEIDDGFYWDVSFVNDPRLPRMGKTATFEEAWAAVATAIETINDDGPIPTVDRRPEINQ